MNIHFLFALCSVLIWNEEVLAEIDNEIKRGVFPFMAFIYYPDETVVDTTGARFQRAAMLIKPQWLVSAAIDHSVLDNVPLGFPRKTLLARVGAVTLDSNYTLNEDEDEQEREVIQIIRPSIHNSEVWWFTDITLLKTLLPFKLTSAVAITSISFKREFADKNCVILVFAKKYSKATEDKILLQIGVELLPPSTNNCGTQFSDSSMICAVDSDEAKTSIYDSDYCQGNSGGPLLCEGEVMALQTYIENNCKQPHLYQLFASWETFIACGTAENCNKNEQCNICVVTNKDPEVNNTIPSTVSLSALDTNVSASAIEPQSRKAEETEIINTETRQPETMILGTGESSESTVTNTNLLENTLENNIENTFEQSSEHTLQNSSEHITTEYHSERRAESDSEHRAEIDSEHPSDTDSEHRPELDSEHHLERQSMSPPSEPSVYPPSEPSVYPLSEPSMYPPAVPSMYQRSYTSEYLSSQTVNQSTEHIAENSLENKRTNITAETYSTTDSSISSSSFSSTENNTFNPWPLENPDTRTVETEEVTRKTRVEELRQVSSHKSSGRTKRYVADANRGFGTDNYLIIFLSILACLI